MHGTRHDRTASAWSDRKVARRSALKIGLMATAAAPLISACGTLDRIWPGSGRQAPGAATNDRTLRVVQTRDFHPDHNAFFEQKIREFAAENGYTLDHSIVVSAQIAASPAGRFVGGDRAMAGPSARSSETCMRATGQAIRSGRMSRGGSTQ